MSAKRGASEAPASGPPKKKLMTQFEPIKIGPIYSLEEMDMKVLQFQNRKLVERIDQRRKAEEELRKRIEQLEQRQTTDDAVLCIVNRYWNQLDEDVRILLQRFDAEGADESGKKNESTAVTSFLTLLSQWDKQEIEETLRQRVEFSKRAICKLLQAYDRLLQRNEKLWLAMKAKDGDARKEADSIAVKTEVKTEPEEGKVEIKKEPEDEDTKEDDVKVKQEPSDEKTLEDMQKFIMNDALREEVERLCVENKRIQELSTELHHKNHELNLKNAELSEKCAAAETETAEVKNQVEDLEYHLDFANQRVDKLDRHLSDALGKLHNYQEGEIKVQGGGEGVSKNKFNEIVTELEEQRELATNRLTELEKLQHDHQDALKVIEKLKMDLSTLPESVIVDTTEYKCLQSQFSVLYNESMQMKTQLDEARNMLANSKNTHLLQIEQMESDELECQKKLRTEVIQLEDQLAQVRREYEMLRIEFEQTLAANEQTGPINREMRNLISSLKNHNEQLKGEALRFKTRLKEAGQEITKRKAELEKGEMNSSEKSASTPTKEKDASSKADSKSDDANSKPEDADKEGGEAGSGNSHEAGTTAGGNKEEDKSKAKAPDVDHIKELKMELKKSQDRERELKLLLDISKSAHKDSRDKVQLMGAERKARAEVEDLKQQVRRLIEAERREKRKLADDDALRAIKKLEEVVGDLKHKLAAQKQEEETLLTEMEVTGQAFEDMQEQNIRLLQQLREKDDANFKLMSERIKWNQIQKLLREEKDVLAEQVVTLQTQVDAQMAVVRQLEDKERILQNTLATIEKELGLRQQALELHKRKAVESAQTAADLKLLLDKYHSQLKEAQVAVTDKTSTLQQQNFKYKRIQEEVASLRRKVERAKKIEMASSADEVLLEEIREYKEQLTCPSCKVKKKDAVLTKCFHVFCLECLRTRYETRQRKCPKCNATFGANDYHRIYLE